MAEGVRQAIPSAECELVPLTDGGDGFVEIMAGVLGLERHRVVVRGPNHAPVAAAYGLSPPGAGERLAVVELAQSSGLVLVRRGDRDPLHASTGGLGEVMAEARQRGAARFLVGIGGSATTDGGTGMARALGYRFLDAADQELPEGGGALARLARIDASGFDSTWLMLPVEVACDVDNPLLGPDGAARVYGPQKGATPAQVEQLEAALTRLAAVLERDLGTSIATLPGAGAAGGTGGGLVAFLGARLEPGAGVVLRHLGLERRLEGAAALVTGEGRLDGQSLHGKGPVAAGRAARAHGVKALAVVGQLGPGGEVARGDAFDAITEVTPRGRPKSARELERALTAGTAALVRAALA